MKDPIVSVLLTTYNQAQWLRQSIESVLIQTYPDWELIVLDNGSTDETCLLLEEYRSGDRVHVIRYQRNSPHTVICNDAIRRARGKYVSILYGDDYYLPSKLERQVAVFETLPSTYGVVYCAGYRLMSQGELRILPCGSYRGNILDKLLTLPQFFQPVSPLIRRECLLTFPFNEALFIEGEGVHNRIAMKYHYFPLNEPLVVMRDHENNLGKEIGPNLERCLLIYEDLFAHPEFPTRLRHLQGQALGGTYRIAGWEALRRERNYSQARQWLKKAVTENRFLLRDPRVLAGLIMTHLPRVVAAFVNGLLDRLFGAPVPPVKAPIAPVCALPEATSETSIVRSQT